MGDTGWPDESEPADVIGGCDHDENGREPYPDDIGEDEQGRPPTDDELRAIGIDPEENRDRRENPRELPDVPLVTMTETVIELDC